MNIEKPTGDTIHHEADMSANVWTGGKGGFAMEPDACF